MRSTILYKTPEHPVSWWSRWARLSVLLAATVAGLCAQNTSPASNTAKAPPTSTLSKARHYAIAYLTSANAGDGSASKPPSTILQSIGDGLAKKLSTQGLVRVPTLDVQCCTLQFTLLSGAADSADSQAKQSSLSVRIVLMDIDTQQVYSRDFRSEGKTTKNAVDDLVGSLLADDKLMHALKGN